LRVNFNYADNAAGAVADRDLAERRGSAANQVEWYAPAASGSASPARIWIPFDLLLLVTELREGVALTLSYNRELLDADRADGFLRHYVATLTELCARPDVPVGGVSSTSTSTSTGTRTGTDAARAASSGQKEGGALRPLPRPALPPLSYAQERMWFLHQLEPQGTAYNMPPIKRRLVGPLDAFALRGALEDLVRRHEALRTVFPSVDGAPHQRILEPGPHALPITDLRGLRDLRGHAEREAELLALIGQEQLRPFDLARGPLLRAHLYRLDDDEHVLVIILHHIVSDGWSLAVLWRELGALYAARQRGAVADLPPLPVQYADYAVWQRAHVSSEQLDKQLGYWIERLAGAPEATALPYRPGYTGWTSSRGAGVSVTLEAERWRRLRELGRGHRASPFVTLLAAFRALLARRSEQDDLCIGTPISNRYQEQVRGLIGCFVNTVVLRTRVDREAGFSALLAAERRTVLSALAHQQAPFEALVAALGGKRSQRSRGRTPLFQVLFALQDLAWEHEDFGGLVGRPVPLPTQSAQVELAIHVFEQRDQLVICFDYAADLFEAAAIEELARDYVSVLEHVTVSPEQALARIPLARIPLARIPDGEVPC
jgi:non-ribosomal peptide synthetase component F